MLIRSISELDLRSLHRSLDPVVREPIYQSLSLISNLMGKVGSRLTDPIELSNTAFEGFISAARR